MGKLFVNLADVLVRKLFEICLCRDIVKRNIEGFYFLKLIINIFIQPRKIMEFLFFFLILI